MEEGSGRLEWVQHEHAGAHGQRRCPVCGTGVFTDVVYEDPKLGGPELRQAGDSYEVLLFSCGHEVKGAPLAAAKVDRMTVERRESEATTEPVEREPSRPWTRWERRNDKPSETPNPDPGPSPRPLPDPHSPKPGPVPQPEPPTPRAVAATGTTSELGAADPSRARSVE